MREGHGEIAASEVFAIASRISDSTRRLAPKSSALNARMARWLDGWTAQIPQVSPSGSAGIPAGECPPSTQQPVRPPQHYGGRAT